MANNALIHILIREIASTTCANTKIVVAKNNSTLAVFEPDNPNDETLCVGHWSDATSSHDHWWASQGHLVNVIGTLRMIADLHAGTFSKHNNSDVFELAKTLAYHIEDGQYLELTITKEDKPRYK